MRTFPYHRRYHLPAFRGRDQFISVKRLQGAGGHPGRALQGGGPAITELIGGQVKMFFNSAAVYLPLVKSGKVRVLATTGLQRADYAPDIPTVAESGLAGFESSNWFAIYGPRKLPAAIAQRWNEAGNRYLQTPQAKDYFG